MKFTPALVDEYLRRIAIDGRSARSIGRDDDMPSYEAFYNLMNYLITLMLDILYLFDFIFHIGVVFHQVF